MAYTINKTDGSVVATITDGTVDTSTTLALFGKSYSGFGEALNENLVKLIENSSSTSASAGDLWVDSDDDQLYLYTGSAWLLAGPVYASGQTLSGWKIETLASSGGNKVVSSMYAGNTRVAILSKESFTPSVTQTGFAQIFAGITLNSTLGAVFSGQTTSAASLDVSSTTNTSGTVIAGGNFLRADASDTTTGALTIDNDTGVIIGGAQELTISVSSNNVTLAQTSENKDFTISTNTSGTQTSRLAITGASGAMAITGDVTITGNLNISGEYNSSVSNVSTYDDAFIKVNSGNAEADAGLIVETGDTEDARLFYEPLTNRWMAGENQNYSQVITLADAVSNGHTNADAVIKTDSSATFTVSGVSLGAVGSISEGDTTNKAVPSIGAVVTFGDLWGGSAKTVSTSSPTSGDGNDGDFWFVRET
jgi:hypothetical protein